MKKFFASSQQAIKIMVCIAVVLCLAAGSLICLMTDRSIMAIEGWMLATVWAILYFCEASNCKMWFGQAKDMCEDISRLVDILDGCKIVLHREMPSDKHEETDGDDVAKKKEELTPEEQDRRVAANDILKCATEAVHYLSQGNDEFSTATSHVELKVLVKHHNTVEK